MERRKGAKGNSPRRIGTADVVRTLAETAGPPAVTAGLGAKLAGAQGAAVGAAAGAGVKALVSRGSWDFITGAAKKRKRQERDRAAMEAEQLFDSLFGPLRRTTSKLGSDAHTRVKGGTHPDNRAAVSAFLGPLGITDATLLHSAEDLAVAGDGDLVLFGGPNSTPLTSTAWEFDGPNSRQLRRPDKPILPLRFYGLSDETDRTLVRDKRIGWHLEGVGEVGTVNWPYIDTYLPGKRYRPEPDYRANRQVLLNAADTTYLPLSNYLLITRLPNFMVQDMSALGDLHPNVWPHLLVVSGNHGLGTRAAELLLEGVGLRALKDAHNELGSSSHAFQVLFRVTDVELEETEAENGALLAYHRFHQIELEAAQPLDHIGPSIYRRAHHRAWEELQQR